MKKAKAAASVAMTPFASGTHGGLTKAASKDAVAYVGAYEAYSNRPVSEEYILKKFGYAKGHVKVDIKGPPEHWDADITATVTYEFPFNIPGIGQLFGKRSLTGGYYLPITSTATIPNEGPQDDRKTIGIGYGTLLQ